MKAATIHELKKELAGRNPAEVLEITLRLARFKAENKELLTYLLFEAHDTAGYIASVKLHIDEEFEAVNRSNIYLAKKTIRKILRHVNKFTRYAADTAVTVDLLLYFCHKFRTAPLNWKSSAALTGVYLTQVKKINKLVDGMHPDVQLDYRDELEKLNR